MATASTPTKLALDEWARILGIHPLHFDGVTYTPENRSARVCDGVWPQYDWQHSDMVSREQVARAIAQAEETIEEYLGYRLAPTWESRERHMAPRYFSPELHNSPYNVRGQHLSASTRWGLFIRPGVRACTLVDAGAAVVWSDEDGDGLPDTGTVAVADVPTGTTEAELRVFYPGYAGDFTAEVRPLTSVVIAGTTATITFPRWYLVKRSITEALTVRPAILTEDDDFEATVDVSRVYNDAGTQGTLLFEPGTCCCGGCDGCNLGASTACLYLRSEPRVSRVALVPSVYDVDTGLWGGCAPVCAAPDLVELNYQAGYQCGHPGCSGPGGVSQEVCDRWAYAIAAYSMQLIDRSTCSCAQHTWEYWREDLALSTTSGSHSQSRATLEVINNPLGTRRGAIYAWQRITDRNVAITQSAQLVG